ncbi:MAG: repeat-associated core protein, partial [Bacteroidetes bacterium]|nr:repeat-associated core protein [Bacteroidota bacterium]
INGNWVDQRNSSWNTPYTFSGKEKDAETGYSYFGARYYDSGLSIWLSVDPMSDKHHNYTPYAYVYNSPIMLKDPYGLDSIFFNSKGSEINRITCKNNYFFLKHSNGNITYKGERYYQGLSKESFFGDRGDKQQLFTKIDERFNQNHEWKFYALARDHKNNTHTVKDFIKESPEHHYYDFKNEVLFKEENPTTVFMVDGVLLNVNEVGNILWGATAASFGFNSFYAQSGAYLFTLIDEYQADEEGEQQAIAIGVTIWRKFNKK